MARILIIDDSTIMRNLLREFLENESHEVDAAVDGDDGITKALASNYNMIFCDLHMPRKNGLQVYEAVRLHKPDATFVFTDSMPDAVSDQLAESKQFHILRKPFDLQQIRAVLTALATEIVRHDLPR